jgi:hypothetical protein
MKFKLPVLFCALILVLTANFAISQTREYDNGINYQAVIRDGDGNILANQEFTLRFVFHSIDEDLDVYSEQHVVTSDEFGIVNLVLLQGTPLNGTHFYSIEWQYSRMQLTTFINDVEMGTTIFRDAPYSKYSEYAGYLAAPYLDEALDDVWIDSDNLATGSLLSYNGDSWANESQLVVVGQNVGIGVEYPSYKLEVEGQVHINGNVTRPATNYKDLLPIAYGMVESDGTINTFNSTPNVTATRDAVGTYSVTIADQLFQLNYFLANLTVVGQSAIAIANSANGKLLITVKDLTGNLVDSRVYFVIYK